MYNAIDELQQAVTGILCLDGNTAHVTDQQRLRETIIDPLVFTAVFAADPAVKAQARSVIRQLAAGLGIRSSSLRQYYLAIGRGEVPTTSTVPAINLRTPTYDIARVLFKLKREQHIGPLIVELARSEMGYTNQRYDEFATAVLAAAIKEGYRGPIFLQADHVQVDAGRYLEDPAAELQTMKRLIKEAMEADFQQIDIVEHHCQDEWQAGWTREQFLYKTRKKAFGPFKQELWELSEEEKQPILETLERQFRFLFEKLRVFDTQQALERYV